MTMAQKVIVANNFQDIDMDDVCDQPRQAILKKPDFPCDCIALIRKAELIDFKSGDSDSRFTLCLDLQFFMDFSGAKCVRNDVNFVDSVFRFCLPRCFQQKFEGVNSNDLVGCMLFSPRSSDKKWANSEDERKSSLPLTMLFKNGKMINRLGLSAFPSATEFITEAKESDHDMAHEFL